jgi:hypothetical protein
MDLFTTSPPTSLGSLGSQRGGLLTAGIFWLPGLLLAGFLAYRRKQLPTWGRSLLTALVLTCGLMGLNACAPFHQSASAGTSNFNVLAKEVDCERGTTATVVTPLSLTITPDN